MNVEMVLREPLGERPFASGDFPVSIGGAGSDVVVPARSAGPIAWLALQDGQLFVQPADDEASVLHNGARITGSTWLRNGDVLDAGAGRLKLRVEGGRRVLEVVAGGHGNVTAPPVAADSSSLAGAGADESERIEPVAFRAQAAPGASAARRWPRGQSRRLLPAWRWPRLLRWSSRRRPSRSRSIRRRSGSRSRAAGRG